MQINLIALLLFPHLENRDNITDSVAWLPSTRKLGQVLKGPMVPGSLKRCTKVTMTLAQPRAWGQGRGTKLWRDWPQASPLEAGEYLKRLSALSFSVAILVETRVGETVACSNVSASEAWPGTQRPIARS